MPSITHFIDLKRSDILGHQLFPMPLVPMEKFMVWDDLPGYPKVFRIGLEFAGIVDKQKLLDAFRFAIARHAMLCARLDGPLNKLSWAISETIRFELRETDQGYEQSPFETQLDIRRGPGLRVWFAQFESTCEFVHEFHHASIDGLGSRAFVRDWFWAYKQLCESPKDSPKLTALEPERLLTRGKFKRVQKGPEVRSTTAWEKAVHAFHFHFRGPQPLIHASESPSEARFDADGPPLHATPSHDHANYFCRKLSKEETAAILEDANSKSMTLNEWMVGRLCYAIAEWNRRNGDSEKDRRIRIMIPASMRGSREHRLPAANRIGFGFVSTSNHRCRTPESALESTLAQTRAIRCYQLGLDFVELFSAASKFSWPTRKILSLKRCMATAVLTNLGDSTNRLSGTFGDESKGLRFGNLTLTGTFGVPPLRPQTHLGMGICIINDQLMIAAATHLATNALLELNNLILPSTEQGKA